MSNTSNTHNFQAFADFFRKAQLLVERVVDEGQSPWMESGGELLLFRHDYGSMNMLQRLTNLVELVGFFCCIFWLPGEVSSGNGL
jgi:hypothetical protein